MRNLSYTAAVFYAVGVGVAVGIILFLLAPLALGQIDGVLASDDETTLSGGLAATLDLVADTAAADPSFAFTPRSDSAEPRQADELKNNHSFFDQSEPRDYPGYDDCDGWQHLVDDGWSATVALTTGIVGDEQSKQLADAVRSYWRSLGYDVDSTTADQGPTTYVRLSIETDYAIIRATIDPRRNAATISGTTVCLPPE